MTCSFFKDWIVILAFRWIGSEFFRKDLGLAWFSLDLVLVFFYRMLDFLFGFFKYSKKEEVD